MGKVYEKLRLPGFKEAKPAIQLYIDSIAGYKRNQHSALEEPLSWQVANAWQRNFEEWGYPG